MALLADAQDEAGIHHRGHVRRFVLDVSHHDEHVDDRLGGQAWYRGAADVLDREGSIAEGRPDARLELGEPRRPRRVVVRDDGRERLTAPDQDGVEVTLEFGS